MRTIAHLILAVFLLSISLVAQNPCAEPHARALVMGGGGSKGAFQAGAVYHLVHHRGCDFVEISGTSVGALNGAILAQAQTFDDPKDSLQTLDNQAEAMVVMWESIRNTKDIVKGRPLATVRFGMFGLESLKNFEPLRKMLEKHVAPERLRDGRSLRAGTVSFSDGRYHEVVLNQGRTVTPHALDYLFGSAILPMFGTMPRIPVNQAGTQVQFSDGAMRQTTPISSYFQVCRRETQSPDAAERCVSLDGTITTPHPRVEQLFVITTSPYVRGDQLRPVLDPKAFRGSTQQIRDGRKIMARALDLLMDTMYRSDLDGMFFSNDLLRWNSEQATNVTANPFPLRSYNTFPDETRLAARPYTLGVVLPDKEDAEITAMLDFSPMRISQQLYCGCVTADRMLQQQFGAESKSQMCTERFRPRPSTTSGKAVAVESFSPELCAAPKPGIQVAAGGSTN